MLHTMLIETRGPLLWVHWKLWEVNRDSLPLVVFDRDASYYKQVFSVGRLKLKAELNTSNVNNCCCCSTFVLQAASESICTQISNNVWYHY